MQNHRTIKLALILTVLVMIVGGFKKCDSSDGVFRGTLSEKKKSVTAKGVKVGSATKINPALLPLIDQGIDDLFRIAAAPPNNYAIPISHPDFKVWLFPRSNKCINPAFLVDATGSPYEGSEWDKNPDPNKCEICAAGMTIFHTNGPGMLVVDDPGIMRTIVRYESEHGLLFYVDRVRFSATMYHPPPHPILGEGDALAASEVAHLVFATKDIPFNDAERICLMLTK